ncbi:hypothetical protein LWI29_011491 [Acer saccharum]|uniref:Uncharacterized protein n=1 Tax=Acer saccharum TaxID=4024 RepID=A0AA39W0X3_ACESA|nr:hypothetical protein LWI29_011491 [Acer saccharum]
MKAIELASGFSIADLYPSVRMLEVISGMKSKIEKLHQERDRILGDIIDEHKERRQTTKTGQKEADEEDLIDVFLRLQEDGDLEFPLTNNNIKAVIWWCLGVGLEWFGWLDIKVWVVVLGFLGLVSMLGVRGFGFVGGGVGGGLI